MHYCHSLIFRPETKGVRGTVLWPSTLIMFSWISSKAGPSQKVRCDPALKTREMTKELPSDSIALKIHFLKDDQDSLALKGHPTVPRVTVEFCSNLQLCG